MNYKIKIVTGFREDQYEIIDIEESHKAYYLFLHPDERAVFENGLALIGKNIQEIRPAYNETMGWNPTHKLDDADYNELREKGVDIKIRDLLQEAKILSKYMEQNKSLGLKTLSEAREMPLLENKKVGKSITNNELKLKENRANCNLCDHTGWFRIIEENKVVPCKCQKLE